jgi:hypothetical protein
MSALGAALTLLSLGVSFDLDAHGVYGAGSRSAFGAVAAITVGQPLWENSNGAGAVEFGFLAGYQAEPYALQAAYLSQAQLSGATHRIEGLFLIGHGARLLSSRRLLFGVHLFGGWTHAVVHGRVVNSELGIDRTFDADAGRLTTGLDFVLGVRLTERISLTARVLLPFPYASEVISWVIPGIGLSVRL